MRYFDTGVLLKLYLPELRAAEAAAFVQGCSHKPFITALHELEIKSAFRQKIGRGEISAAECQVLIGQVDSDLMAGVHERREMNWRDVFLTADSLSATHAAATLCRSLDTLHVAAAIELGAREFCTFDHRQSRMAAAAGLHVIS